MQSHKNKKLFTLLSWLEETGIKESVSVIDKQESKFLLSYELLIEMAMAAGSIEQKWEQFLASFEGMMCYFFEWIQTPPMRIA